MGHRERLVNYLRRHQWEIQAGGDVSSVHGKAIPRQQFGRTRDRDRAGSIGRAGRSKAGKRLAGFFIGRFLNAGDHNRNSH
jgi:hypothetical protein